jgi:hypothetical protein
MTAAAARRLPDRDRLKWQYDCPGSGRNTTRRGTVSSDGARSGCRGTPHPPIVMLAVTTPPRGRTQHTIPPGGNWRRLDPAPWTCETNTVAVFWPSPVEFELHDHHGVRQFVRGQFPKPKIPALFDVFAGDEVQ